MYQIYFYVPRENLDALLDAMFTVGGGTFGDYDRCCWITEGNGQFRPLSQSKPHKGIDGQTIKIPELKVEMICVASKLAQVIDELKSHHPYEQPAYGVSKLEEI